MKSYAPIPELIWLLELCVEAGKLIRKDFDAIEKDVDYKISSADLVTKTDVAVENFLVETIKQKYPSHSFLCEESYKHQKLTDAPTWVIDPVDGTMNFVKKIPFVAVSIGFTIKKEVELGVIYNPILDELFFAKRNEGAYLVKNASNSASTPIKLNVSSQKPLAQMVVATGFSAGLIRMRQEAKTLNEDMDRKLKEVQDVVFQNTQALLLNCRDLRRTGSCACDMASVALGRFDAVAELSVKEWDVCAGCLIVQESGGVVSNFNGLSTFDIGERNFIATNSETSLKELSQILKKPSFDMRTLE